VAGKNAHVEDGRLVPGVASAVVVRHGENESGCLTTNPQQRPPTTFSTEAPARGHFQEATSGVRGTQSGNKGNIRGIG
jgi:hypothetical protein